MRENKVLTETSGQSGRLYLISGITGAVTATMGVLLMVWVSTTVGAFIGAILAFLGVLSFVQGIRDWARRTRAAVDPGQEFGRYSSLTVMLWFLSVALFFRAYFDVYRMELSNWTIAWVALGVVVWVISMVASKRAIKRL